MAAFLKKLHEANEKRGSTTTKMSDLTLNKLYPVVEIKEVQTTYGQRIKVCLRIEKNIDAWFYIGDEYNDIFDKNCNTQLESGELKLFFRFEGMQGRKQIYQIIPGKLNI